MRRQIFLSSLWALAVVPSFSHALGLGEIKLKSHLNQPLRAEVELVQLRELTSSEILPALANPKDFDAAGVDRAFFLTDMRFEVKASPEEDKGVILITTRKPVREPYLNFLIEVVWPAGRLLREYTLLLDPPLYAEDAASSVSPVLKTAEPAERINRTQSESSPQPSYSSRPPSVQRQVQPSVSSPSTRQSGASASSNPALAGEIKRESYVTRSNDSLWKIAESVRPDIGASVQQTMIAIQHQNPDAFVDGNINLLKKGKVLRIPDAEAVWRTDPREAIREVARQNKIWKTRLAAKMQSSQPLSGSQIDSTGKDLTPTEPANFSGEGRITLASGEGGSDDVASGAGGDGAGDKAAGSSQALVQDELLQKARLEKADLSEQVRELREQLETSGKLLNLKDEQLRAFQQKLKELEEQNKRLLQQVVPEQVPSEQEQPEPVTGDLETSESGLVQDGLEETVPEEMLPEEMEEIYGNYDDQPGTGQEPEVMPEGIEEEPVIDAPVPVPAPPVTAPASNPTLMEKLTGLLQNPIYLFALGGVSVVLILGVLIWRRKSAEAEEEEFDLENDPEFGSFAELEEAQSEEDDDETDETMRDKAVDPALSGASDVADIIGEADIYMAYGRFDHARQMLQKAIDQNPDHPEFHLKMLEVCIESQDVAGFKAAEDCFAKQNFGDEYQRRLTELREQIDGLDVTVASEAVSDESESLMGVSSSELDFSLEGEKHEHEAQPTSDYEPDETDTSLSALDELESGLVSDMMDSEEDEAEADRKASGFSRFEAPEDKDEGVSNLFSPGELDFTLDEEADSVKRETSMKQVSMDKETLSGLFDSVEAEEEGRGTGSTQESAQEEAQETLQDFTFEMESGIEAEAQPPKSESEDEELLKAFVNEEFVNEEKKFNASEEDFTPDLSALDADLNAFDEEFNLDKQPESSAVPLTPAEESPAQPEETLSEHMLDNTDETATKLDLARAYIDMGDREGAKDILDEILQEGDDQQQHVAKELLKKVG